jgi:hypothetical protein
MSFLKPIFFCTFSKKKEKRRENINPHLEILKAMPSPRKKLRKIYPFDY